ncbi:MAG: InlB B-repeat-containing protein, partial [Clostridiales bacterium]|nr:InlB B-repeat-containing protein [Clostridiales bacterium]
MTNQWKRLLSGMLALALAFSLFVPAMATSVEDETADDQTAVTDVVDDTSQDTEAAETETDEAETPADAESEEEVTDTETDEESADSPAQENEEAVPEGTASDETSEPETDAVAEKVAAVVEADTAAQTVTAVADAEAEPVAVAESEAAAEEIAEAEPEAVAEEPAAEDDTEADESEEDVATYEAQIGETQYATLAEAFAAAADGDTIELLSDVTLSSAISINSNIRLTLTSAEGHTYTITRSGRSMRMLYVQKATLTLSNLILDGAYSVIDTNTYSMVEVTSSGTVIMNSGVTMQNAVCSYQARGGAVTVSGSGTFTMNGGTVTCCGNSKSSGSTNSAGSNPGGAICVYASGSSTVTTTFTMNGGTIENCFGIRGGAVYVGNANANATVKFIMNGGTIKNCVAATSQGGSATGYGGAIFVMGKGSTQKYIPTVYINGGEITGCKAYRYGGALGTITSDSSTAGNYYAGAYVIMGGYIHGNTTTNSNPSSGYGNGVFVTKYMASSSLKSDDTTLTIGGSARIEDDIYLEKYTTMNVVDDFTGFAKVYNAYKNEGKTLVAYAVTSDGTSTTATSTIAGQLLEVYGFLNGDGETYADPSYTIAVNPDDNTQYILGTPITVTFTDGADGTIFEDTTYTVISGNTIPDFVPTRTGYTFVKWVDENGNDAAETVTEDVTYIAVWTANTYTVTLNGNGATLDTETVEATYGSAYPELPTPTLKGLTGEGWYIDNGDGTYTAITDETVVSIAGDHDLIYLWSVADFSVTLTCGYKTGKWSLSWTSSLEPFNLIATVTQIDGLTYSYQWYKDDELIEGATDSTLTINGNVRESGVYKVVVTATLADGSDIILVNSSATATAQNTLKITRVANALYYNTNGGTDGPSNNFANLDTVTVQTKVPTREGYTFVSWNTEADGSGDSYVGGDSYDFSKYYDDVDTLANGGLKAYLYAIWSANSYTLTLDAGDGAFSDGNSTTTIPVTYNSAIGELPVPTREGYTFGGWVDAEGNLVTEETIYTTAGNSTLTAVWTANEYTITVDPGNGDEPYEVTVTYEDVVADKIDDPEREGYTFEGWVDEDGNPVNLNVTYTEDFPD